MGDHLARIVPPGGFVFRYDGSEAFAELVLLIEVWAGVILFYVPNAFNFSI